MQPARSCSARNALPVSLLLALTTTAAAAPCVIAQAWPAKPLRLIAPFPAGGGADIVGRMLAQRFCDAVPLRQITFFPQRPQRVAPRVNRELNVFRGMSGRDEAAPPALGIHPVHH